jgi:hypothetical protein
VLLKTRGMTPRKLSESDKDTILDLYRQIGETTSTLASRYGVSNSTISRILKSTLPEEEYEVLVQQKRAGAGKNQPQGQNLIVEPTAPMPVVSVEQPTLAIEQPEAAASITHEVSEALEVAPTPSRRLRKRSSVASQPATEAPQIKESQLQLLDISAEVEELKTEVLLEEREQAEATVLQEMLGEELLPPEEALADADLDEDDDDLEDLDEDDLEDDNLLEEGDTQDFTSMQISATTSVQVLPLSEASIPKTCYLVVDRAAELITRPLRDFGDLGQIPAEEIQERTLPIFDNHRVARRFSKRTQRVIKVPDGRMLRKACSQLQAKGITRLLIDGQVYSL